MGSNMLSVKKVKQHGLQDPRWTVNDHKTQYKGLVRLFERDRKINEGEIKVALKKNKKEIKYLLKNITLQRQKLDNSVGGDRQRINNLLAIDRNLKLALNELEPQKITDHIFQDNFSKRKAMDLLKYKLNMKIDRLIKLRIEESDLQDHLKYSTQQKSQLEIQIGVTTGKVQDMILKKEAAITVKTTYKVLVDLFRKDSIYYNSLLDALWKDCFAQSKCLIRATMLGQLATEHLDDTKLDLEHLQTVVKADRKLRLADIEIARGEILQTMKNLHSLIRRDSDLNLGGISQMQVSESFTTLETQILELTEYFTKLQDATMVAHFDDIFPCLKEQDRQNTRLKDFLKTALESHSVLSKRKEHSQRMLDLISNNTNNQAMEYNERKNMLKDEIARFKTIRKTMICDKNRLGAVLTNIRSCLQNIESMCKMIRVYDTDDADFIIFQADGKDMVRDIFHKIMYLTSGRVMDPIGINITNIQLSADQYSEFINTTKPRSILMTKEWKDDTDEMIMEDSSIPTRADIKEQSRQLHEYFESMKVD